MMQYYLSKNSASTACNFNGQGQTQASSTTSDCETLIKEAGGIAGTGTVTSSPKGSSSSSAASVLSMDIGRIKIGAALVSAFTSGILAVML